MTKEVRGNINYQPNINIQLINSDLARSNRRGTGLEDELTESARGLMRKAKNLARNFGYGEVTEDQLQLALLNIGNSVGIKVLESAGIRENQQLDAAEKILNYSAPRRILPENELSRGAEMVLQYAREEARLMGEAYVGTHHILIGLFRIDNSDFDFLNMQNKFDLDSLRRRTSVVISDVLAS